jgi:hypothetical protein
MIRARAVAWFVALGLAACETTPYGANPNPPPPPPRAEVMPKPPITEEPMSWRPGHWEWTGTGYSWQQGEWVPSAGHSDHWLNGHWQQNKDGTWSWAPGRWM